MGLLTIPICQQRLTRLVVRPKAHLSYKHVKLLSHRSPVSRPGVYVRPCRDSNNGSAETSPTGPSSTVDLLVTAGDDIILDERVSPLRVALEKAQSKEVETTSVREALEAEAQEVAQLAVEANEAKEAAKTRVFNAVAEIETATRQQQEASDKLSRLQKRIDAARDAATAAAAAAADAAALAAIAAAAAAAAAAPADAAAADAALAPAPAAPLPEAEQAAAAAARAAELQGELEALEADVVATKADLSSVTTLMEELREKVKTLFERAVSAEAAAQRAEEVAAAAMKAAEGAVKDEMEAAAVVRETRLALEKIIGDLQALDASRLKEETAEGQQAEAAKAEAAAVASAAAAADKAADDTSKAATPDKAEPKAASPAPPAEAWQAPKWLVAGLGVAAATAGVYMLSKTGAVQAAVQAAQDMIGPVVVGEAEKGIAETIWLLLTSIICVPAVCKLIPGGNPVLGYLVGGALVGPYALNIIHDVSHVRHLAELGVVFLLFNIGLELSLDRLQSMAKLVFGLGSMQVVLTLLGVAGAAMAFAHLPGPSAIILGGALAMSTTAVAIQVLEDRGEMGSRHGRSTFSVLLFQDLAVVVLLMLIPLLAPSETGSAGGAAKIAKALAAAAIKAALCIAGIIAGGRAIVRPLYKKISSFANAEIFAATGLLMVLGTSLLTQVAGLSLALGAFLAGLLLAETEYALQVESDIAPYKGLLMGLFFMTVGMEISMSLFIAKWKTILASLTVLIVGKVAVMAAVGPLFGLSRLTSIRSGLLLAPGGEFAFVAFGEAVSRGVLPAALTNELYLMVALSMALTPYLAALGSKMGQLLDKKDMQALQPSESETQELKDHVIIAGYGRVGQIISQVLAEELIPFVALDVNSGRVAAGRELDLPIYFGDAGSPAVLHSIGAERAACAVITLDTPGANYRSVWALHKHYPHVKIYVRAHDINHGINLEKAGATAVVPETLEPSLQLAAAVLNKLEYPGDEVSSILDQFRRKHLAELRELSMQTGTSLGYGFRKDNGAQPDKGTIDVKATTSLAPSPA